MKKFNAGARCAGLAAVSAAGVLIAQAALAQPWIESRAWPQSSVYENGPVILRDEPRAMPRYAPPAALPRRAVRQIIQGQGFEIIRPMEFTGDAYIVQALDQRGRVRRLVVDARDGHIIESASLVALPRSGADINRGGLPPGGFAPRGEWDDHQFGSPPPSATLQERRAREQFARQSPDGFDRPRDRMNDMSVSPRFNPAPPALETQRKATAPKQRAVAKPQQKPAPRQATRTPSVEPQPSVKTEPTAPAAPRAATPESAPRGNAMLRRPSQSAETTGSTSPRTGVASAPAGQGGAASRGVVSSGAEPQRKAPRVVYPGPGSSAPIASGAD